jgi:hypothetical protein
MESGYEGVLCCTDLLCLGRGQVLNRVNVLKSEIEIVLEMKGKSFHPLCNHERLYCSAVRGDITQHKELNVNLQVAIHLDETFGKITAFERKFRLPELQLRSGCDSLQNSQNGNVHRQ